ncbi:MAG: hypothetical protein GY730_00615 [bacterium]|nr:hypothetical protein [bacterium]
MLTGKEKAQILLALLEDQAQNVLAKLSPESSALLTSSIEDAPKPDPADLNILFSEVLTKVDEIKSKSLLDAPDNEEHLESIDKTTGEESLLYSDDENKEGEISNKDITDAGESDSLIEDPEDNSEEEPPQRDISEIADILSRQKPQIIAFFLAKVDDEMRVRLIEHLPKKIRSQIESHEIEPIPISDSVFKNLYESILKSAEPKTDDQEADKIKEAEEGSFSDHTLVSETSSFSDKSDFEDDLSDHLQDNSTSAIPENDADIDSLSSDFIQNQDQVLNTAEESENLSSSIVDLDSELTPEEFNENSLDDYDIIPDEQETKGTTEDDIISLDSQDEDIIQENDIFEEDLEDAIDLENSDNLSF